MKTLSLSLSVSVVLALSLVLVACVVPTPQVIEKVVEKPVTVTVEKPVVETVVPEAKKVKITLWLPDTVRWKCTGEKLIPEFNAQSSIAEVIVSHKAKYEDALRPALAAGVGPDIFQIDVDQAAEMAEAGLLFPLDGFAAAFDWDQRFASWALDLGKTYDGKLYTIPAELETLVLFYNKTVFEEKGWTPPNTIDEMLALAEQIEAEGLIPFAGIGLACPGCFRWYIGEFFNSVAGPEKVYQALKGEIPWTDPAFVEAITLLNDIVQKGWMMGGVDKFFAADWDAKNSAFASGKAVMNIEGTWFRGQEGKYFGPESGNPNVWDWVPMPTATGEDIYTIGLGSSWSVNASIENPKAVGEFLNWYLSPEIQGKQFAVCLTNPAPVPVTEEMMEGADPRFMAIFSELVKAAAEGRYGYTLWTFWPPQTNTYARDAIQKVWTGEMTVEEYLEGFNRVFAEELAAGAVPPIPKR